MWSQGSFANMCPTMGQQHRHYSTAKLHHIPLLPTKMLDIAPHKKFTNPNYVNFHAKPCPSPSSSPGCYPNNLRRGDPLEHTRTKNKHEKERRQLEMDIREDVDEVGTDACEACGTTIEKPFIAFAVAASSPVQISFTKTYVACNLSPDCASEDSFVVFEGGPCDEDDEGWTDEEEEDEETDDDESDVVDFNDNSCKSTPRTDWVVLPCRTRKKVHFPDDKDLAEVHNMYAWSHAYQAARKGHWEEYARDRERFRRRIDSCAATLGAVLGSDHRRRVYDERFSSDPFVM